MTSTKWNTDVILDAKDFLGISNMYTSLSIPMHDTMKTHLEIVLSTGIVTIDHQRAVVKCLLLDFSNRDKWFLGDELFDDVCLKCRKSLEEIDGK